MDLAHISDMEMAQYWAYCSEQGLNLRDIVHGNIQLGPVVKKLYNTPAVQRLGQLQQLGCCSVAIPGAVHSRLVHSVGTAHLAAATLKHLAATGHKITPLDVELIALAGLCHDAGHGPFSHMFESLFLPAVGVTDWCHEDMSAQLLQYTVDTCNIDISQEQLQFIQHAISGGSSSSSSSADWRFQIVANKKNSIDVDKIDYLLRDALMCGQGWLNDFRALLHNCKVIGQDICYHECQQASIAALFNARAAMHREVYQHPLAKAAELMVVDAMKAADPVLQISSRIHSPGSFLSLTDTVVDDIRCQAERCSQDPHLQQAAAIIRRLEQGDQYAWVAELTVPTELAIRSSRDECWLSAADVAAHQDHNIGVPLQQDDIRLQNVYIDHCKGASDPLDAVLLYSSSNGVLSSSSSSSDVSHTWPASHGIARPDVFVTQQVRVHLAKACQGSELALYMYAVQAAFARAAQHRFGHHIHICSRECSCPLSWRTHSTQQQQQRRRRRQQYVGNGEMPSPQALMKPVRVSIGSTSGSTIRSAVQRKVFGDAAPAGSSMGNGRQEGTQQLG